MSWGIKITVLYLGFVSIILTLVFICFSNKTELEFKDYYAKELKFQDQINAESNANELPAPIDYKIMDRAVQIILPKELLSNDFKGTVLFLRPSDASRDKMIQLLPGEDGIQTIDPGFIRGVYKMQISVHSLGKNYFKEAIINFN